MTKPYLARLEEILGKPKFTCTYKAFNYFNYFLFQVRHHWRAVREQNYVKGSDNKRMNYYNLPDGRQISSQEDWAPNCGMEAGGQDGAPPTALTRPSPKLRSAAACLGEVEEPLFLPPGASQPLQPPAGQAPGQLEREALLLEAWHLLQHASTCLRRYVGVCIHRLGTKLG